MAPKEWYLDEIRQADKNAFLAHLNHREIHENTSNIPFPYTEKDADDWIQLKIAETKANGRPIVFAIRLVDGSLIGSIGFDGLCIGQTHAAEIGYWLAKPYWNRGIMTSVVKEACKIGFHEFGLVRIQARVFSSNLASSCVLEKCGFVQEGYLRMAERKNGEYKDVKIFARLQQ